MFDLSFLQILTRAIAIVVVLTVLGFGLAGFARLLGDKGVRYDGKITLNPIVHADIFAVLAGIIGRIGWVRPIAIDPTQCRGGRLGPVLAAIGAMVALYVFGRLLLLTLPWVATSWPASSAAFVDSTIREIGYIVGWTLTINIAPLPPLLGGYLLQAVAPKAHAWLVKQHFWVSLLLLVIVFLSYRSLPRSALSGLAVMLGAR